MADARNAPRAVSRDTRRTGGPGTLTRRRAVTIRCPRRTPCRAPRPQPRPRRCRHRLRQIRRHSRSQRGSRSSVREGRWRQSGPARPAAERMREVGSWAAALAPGGGWLVRGWGWRGRAQRLMGRRQCEAAHLRDDRQGGSAEPRHQFPVLRGHPARTGSVPGIALGQREGFQLRERGQGGSVARGQRAGADSPGVTPPPPRMPCLGRRPRLSGRVVWRRCRRVGGRPSRRGRWRRRSGAGARRGDGAHRRPSSALGGSSRPAPRCRRG